MEAAGEFLIWLCIAFLVRYAVIITVEDTKNNND